MKKFSTQLAKAILVMTAMTGSAYANWECDPCYDPCDSNCSDNSLYVSADFLWWKPNIDGLDYAATREVVPSQDGNGTDNLVQYHNVCPNWKPGVRGVVGLNHLYEEWNLTASYTYMGVSGINELEVQPGGAFIVPTTLNGLLIRPQALQGQYLSVESNYNSAYNNWDILLSHDVSCSPCLDVLGFFGFSALYMDQYWRMNYALPISAELPPTTAQVTWQSDFWGAGIKIGYSMNYNFMDCFSAFGTVSASLLTGRDDNIVEGRTFSIAEGPLTTIYKAEDDTDHWQLVPGYHIQTGVRYETSLCGTTLGLRVGYEFVNWYNLPNQRIATASGQLEPLGLISTPTRSTVSTSPNTRQYGFHGLFVGGDVQF